MGTKVPKENEMEATNDYVALATECYMCLCDIEVGAEICEDCDEMMNDDSGFTTETTNN